MSFWTVLSLIFGACLLFSVPVSIWLTFSKLELMEQHLSSCRYVLGRAGTKDSFSMRTYRLGMVVSVVMLSRVYVWRKAVDPIDIKNFPKQLRFWIYYLTLLDIVIFGVGVTLWIGARPI